MEFIFQQDGASAHTARNARSAQCTELAVGQLSRYHHKRPMASKFAAYKPNGLSHMAVFFNLFVAAEPYTSVKITHGTP